MVVVPGIAKDQDRGLGPDLLAILLPEHPEGVAVIGVPVDPDHIGLGIDSMHGLPNVLHSLKKAGHLV